MTLMWSNHAQNLRPKTRMTNCPKCNQVLEDAAEKCGECGAELEADRPSSSAFGGTATSNLWAAGKLLVGTVIILFVIFVLLAPLPYPLGGSIGAIIIASLFPKDNECLTDERSRLEAYLLTGTACVVADKKTRSLQLTLPVITWADANSRHSKTNYCLIEHAILNGSAAAFKTLLQNGADPNVCPGSVDAVYEHILYRRNHDSYVDFAMILKEANYYPKKPERFLFGAAKQSSVLGVRRAVRLFGLLQSIDGPDSDGKTPLYHAILAEPTSNSWATVRELIKLGANIDKSSSGGESPLSKARRLYSGTRYQLKFERELAVWRELENSAWSQTVHTEK